MDNATPRPLYLRESPGYHFTGGWVWPRAGLDGCGKSHPTVIGSPDRPARCESLYRLRYPSPHWHWDRFFFFQVLHFSAVSIIPPLIYTYVPFNYYRRHKIFVIQSVVQQYNSLLSTNVTFYHNTNSLTWEFYLLYMLFSNLSRVYCS